MPSHDPDRRTLQSKVAAAIRHDLPDAPDLRRDLAACKLEAYIRKVVDEAPPLTTEQLQRLAVLLNPGTAA